eukprot:12280383-Alexandrium_andersonii.AAC.1
MSASLVGSEMCIRDRVPPAERSLYGLPGRLPVELSRPWRRPLEVSEQHHSVCAAFKGLRKAARPAVSGARQLPRPIEVLGGCNSEARR